MTKPYHRFIRASAIIEGNYRYSLTRLWDYELPSLPIVMLNPSTADETHDDPTIRKCSVFADQNGYGGMEVVNLFAYRCTSPQLLLKLPADELVGHANNFFLSSVLSRPRVLVAWGSWGSRRIVSDQVKHLMLLRDSITHAAELVCLGVTKDGQPVHPLMQPYSSKLVRWQQTHQQESQGGDWP